MKLTTYAEVFDANHRSYQLYKEGVKKSSGHLLRDVLKETGGRYEVIIQLPDVFLRDVQRGLVTAQKLAATTSSQVDQLLSSAAATGTVRISLEHLRGLDPNTTKIVYGVALGVDAATAGPCKHGASS